MAFFGEVYLRSTRPLLNPAVTTAEVHYLAERLPRSGPVLDVGCGHGRHAHRLWRLGLPVVGLELDPLSLAEREGAFPAIRADMRSLPVKTASLAAAFAWYSTLFALRDEEHPALLAELARAIRPGGLLILHTVPFERLERTPEAELLIDLEDGTRLEEHSRFDPATGRDVGARTLKLADGRVLSGTYSIRYYRLAELSSMLEGAGFHIRWVYGELCGRDLATDSTDLILGAERRDG